MTVRARSTNIACVTGPCLLGSVDGVSSVELALGDGLELDGTTLNAASGGVSDHGALTGLSDDDHAQYVLAAGRSGQTVLNGGVASGANLTINSTAHATKGTLNLNGTTANVNSAGEVSAKRFLGNEGWGGAVRFYNGLPTIYFDYGLYFQSGGSAIMVQPGGTEPLIVRGDNVGRFGKIHLCDAGNTLGVSLVAGAALLDVGGAVKVGAYTFATVPSASSYTGAEIRITDRAQRRAYSDGTNWRFLADDAVIS